MSTSMITIKKSDGTFAKVTLSELKKIQADKKQQELKKTIVSAPVIPSNQSANQVMGKSTIQMKTNSSQSKDAVPKNKKMTRVDASSPLEEKITGKSQASFTSHKRDSQVEEVVRKIGFGVAPDLQGRLKSLILARLKDIKSEDEIQETLVRPIKNGGLGLSESQVEKVFTSCREVLGARGSDLKESHFNTPVLKGKSAGMALMVEPPELPMVVPNYPLTSTAPVSSKQVEKAVAPTVLNSNNDVVSKIIIESMANEPVFKISSQDIVRNTMHDVSVPDNEMGPVEEFRSATVAEFRRLSSNPEEAAKRLQQKMFNLQEESYIWYLDGISAFHNSPLYVEYMTAVCQSLVERKTLSNILAAHHDIKLTEIMAIIEMEQAL